MRISSWFMAGGYRARPSLDSRRRRALAFGAVPQLSLHTPIGDISISEEEGAIVAVDWGWGSQQSGTSLLRRACEQLHAYFDGELTAFDLPLAPVGTAYRQHVWRALCAIPYGETRSYIDIARVAGGSPRSVGQANGNNPIPIIIPCHRVVLAPWRLSRGPAPGRLSRGLAPVRLSRGATTHLGGYSGGDGLATKRWLLALEAHAQPLLQPIPSAAA
jgi:methylated-DNA-[protein]-cysteine S-methyltransferase